QVGSIRYEQTTIVRKQCSWPKQLFNELRPFIVDTIAIGIGEPGNPRKTIIPIFTVAAHLADEHGPAGIPLNRHGVADERFAGDQLYLESVGDLKRIERLFGGRWRDPWQLVRVIALLA